MTSLTYNVIFSISYFEESVKRIDFMSVGDTNYFRSTAVLQSPLLKEAGGFKVLLKNIIDKSYRWNTHTGDGETANKLREEVANDEYL